MKLNALSLSNVLSIPAKVSLVRAQIVPHIAGPAILSVTSATADDGAHHLSYLLAESFHSCGELTLIVDFSNEGDRLLRLGQRVGQDLSSELSSHILKRGELGPDLLRVYVADNGALPGHTLLKALFHELTQQYQVVLLSLPQPTQNPHALFCLMFSTAILVAVRQGRSLCQADLQLAHGLLEPGKCLGVVTLEAALIDHDPSIHLGQLKSSMPTVKGDHLRKNHVLEPLN